MKWNSVMKLSKRTGVDSTTFYRNLIYVVRAVRIVWKEEQNRLMELLKESHLNNKPKCLLSIDGAWNQRGHTSELGNFAAVLISEDENLNNKVLYATTKLFARRKFIQGKDVIVQEGNHTGSSHAMETESFSECLDFLGVPQNETNTTRRKSVV